FIFSTHQRTTDGTDYPRARQPSAVRHRFNDAWHRGTASATHVTAHHRQFELYRLGGGKATFRSVAGLPVARFAAPNSRPGLLTVSRYGPPLWLFGLPGPAGAGMRA